MVQFEVASQGRPGEIICGLYSGDENIMRQQRNSLCIGCRFAKEFQGSDVEVHCLIVGRTIQPVPHKIGMRFEDCPHRCQEVIPADLESIGERLVRLAKHARAHGTANMRELPQHSVQM